MAVSASKHLFYECCGVRFSLSLGPHGCAVCAGVKRARLCYDPPGDRHGTPPGEAADQGYQK